MEEALVARLRANAGLAALVGNKIDWLARPPGDELPGTTLQVVSPGRGYEQEGADPSSNPRVRADHWARNYAEAKRIARAFRTAIETPAVQGDVKFGHSFQAAERDLGPEDLPGGLKAVRVQQEFFVWWKRA